MKKKLHKVALEEEFTDMDRVYMACLYDPDRKDSDD